MFRRNNARGDEFALRRRRMVEEQIRRRGVTDPRVLAAMEKVPRHLFVDEALWSQAYSDYPLPIGHGQTISQPYIVALMTEELGLSGDERVLEVGTGSGYQAAILAELAREVYTVERIPDLLRRARRTIEDLGYTNVRFKLDDGTWGWKEMAPFDAVIVTAASPRVPEPLLEQLRDPGVMVIPVGDEYSQSLVKVVKKGGEIREEDRGGVRFVKLIGDHGWRA